MNEDVNRIDKEEERDQAIYRERERIDEDRERLDKGEERKQVIDREETE